MVHAFVNTERRKYCWIEFHRWTYYVFDLQQQNELFYVRNDEVSAKAKSEISEYCLNLAYVIYPQGAQMEDPISSHVISVTRLDNVGKFLVTNCI